jgi:hypothetical protein
VIVHGRLQTICGMLVDQEPWELVEQALVEAVDVAKDVEEERARCRALLARLVDASDGRPDDPEWLEALYAARNELRDDQAKEADRG